MSTTHNAYATACGQGSTEGGLTGRAAQPNKELLLSASRLPGSSRERSLAR